MQSLYQKSKLTEIGGSKASRMNTSTADPLYEMSLLKTKRTAVDEEQNNDLSQFLAK
jgi:hypothetical protein